MLKTKLIAAAGAVALLGGLGAASLAAASAASASTTYTATTQLTNRPDSGNNANNGGDWAVDTLTRVATLTNLGVDPHHPGFDTYSFGLSDTGTFVTDAGVASNPNGLNPLTLLLAQSGTVKGTGTWTNFDVPVSVTPSVSGVPSSQDGAGTPSSDWLKYFFKGESPTLCPATGAESVNDVADNCGQETQFSYSYTTCAPEHWLDANTDVEGNAIGVTSTTDLATIGGISGAACPVVTPTPSPSASTPAPAPSPSSPVVPVGGVQTGGGKAGANTGALVGYSLILLALVVGSGAMVLRRRARQGS